MTDIERAFPYQDYWVRMLSMAMLDPLGLANWDIGIEPVGAQPPPPDRMVMAPGTGRWLDAKIKCQYCGQWGAPMSVCLCCGGPTQ